MPRLDNIKYEAASSVPVRSKYLLIAMIKLVEELLLVSSSSKSSKSLYCIGHGLKICSIFSRLLKSIWSADFGSAEIGRGPEKRLDLWPTNFTYNEKTVTTKN